jgi:hypothetical protein
MADKPDPWNINEADFPREGSDAEKLAFCVRYAVLAPSTYNSQPWHFVVRGSSVYLYADRRFGLPVIDPEDRELVIACGCTLFNLRLAIRSLGYNETTELLPDPDDGDLLARVKLGEPREPVQSDRDLFNLITRRHGNRSAFASREVEDEKLRALKAEAAEEGAWLYIPGGVDRKIVIRLIAEGDHIQLSQKKFRRELAGWVHSRRIISGDGMPQEHLTYDDVMNTMGPFAIRRFAMDDRSAADDRELEESSPVIAVLGSKAGGDLERLYTGQALQRLWLRAEKEGLSISTLNQVCETPDLRIRLHDVIKHPGRAQIILRVGYGGRPHFTDRRPMHQILDFEGKGITKTKERSESGEINFIGRVRKLFLAK